MSATSVKLSSLILCLALLLLGPLTSGCSPRDASITLNGNTMGTTYSVVLPKEAAAAPDLAAGLDAVLVGVNQQMSTYIETSELSRLNQATAGNWIKASPDLIEVMQAAIRISQLTQGAYDVSVGPLVNLWGFGPDRHADVVPSASEISAALQRVGYDCIELDSDASAVRKCRDDLYIDLSSIAKGFGADKVASYLEGLGVDNYLIEIGGEMRAKGMSPRGDLWKVAIERPDQVGRSVQQVINLTNIAVASSGDYRNYFEVDGVRYAHTIDARTGRPVRHRLASVTVLADDGMTADAWATALMVLGEEEGLELAEREGLAAYLIVKADSGFEIIETAAFKQKTGLVPSRVQERD